MRFTRKPRCWRRCPFVQSRKKMHTDWDKKATKNLPAHYLACKCALFFKYKNCVNGKSVTLKHLWLVVLTAADTNRAHTVCRSANKFLRESEFQFFSLSMLCASHATRKPFSTILSSTFHYHCKYLASVILCHNCITCSSRTTDTFFHSFGMPKFMTFNAQNLPN